MQLTQLLLLVLAAGAIASGEVKHKPKPKASKGVGCTYSAMPMCTGGPKPPAADSVDSPDPGPGGPGGPGGPVGPGPGPDTCGAGKTKCGTRKCYKGKCCSGADFWVQCCTTCPKRRSLEDDGADVLLNRDILDIPAGEEVAMEEE